MKRYAPEDGEVSIDRSGIVERAVKWFQCEGMLRFNLLFLDNISERFAAVFAFIKGYR